MSSKHFFVYILLGHLLVNLAFSTLSQSSPRGNKVEEDDEWDDDELNEGENRRSKLMDLIGHEHDDEARKDIVETYDTLEIERPHRDFIKLAYVTPWYNHGYDVAKWAANKFTHIAPVWFQFAPKYFGRDLACEITGQHDIDQDWMDDIRKNNSDIKFVPRFLFETDDSKLVDTFLKEDFAQIRCVDAIIKLVQEINGDGVVLEAFLQVVHAVRTREAMLAAADFVGRASRRIRKQNLISIMPLNAMVYDGQVIIDTDLLQQLYKDVDYINLMTYDYAAKQYKGLAPVPWIEANVQFLAETDDSLLSKTLLGVNYYGACYKDGQITHIFGRDAARLVKNNEELVWDEETGQHFVETREDMCAIPTKRSIEIKLDLVQKHGLPGIAIWDLGQGFNHFTQIL